MSSRFHSVGLLLVTLATNAEAASWANVPHGRVELVAERTTFAPGVRAWVGVEIAHDSGWHTYWINPGDSGLPTKLEWKLPQDFHAGEIAWPVPKRFDLGGLYNFGYDGNVLLPVAIDVPSSARAGSAIAIAVSAKWLICSHEICLPGKTSLALKVPIANGEGAANATAAPMFAKARAMLPTIAPWHGAAKLSADRVHIELSGKDLPNTAKLDIFSTAPNVIDNSPPKISSANNRIIAEVAKSEYLQSVPSKLTLILSETAREPPIAWKVEVPLGPVLKTEAGFFLNR